MLANIYMSTFISNFSFAYAFSHWVHAMLRQDSSFDFLLFSLDLRNSNSDWPLFFRIVLFHFCHSLVHWCSDFMRPYVICQDHNCGIFRPYRGLHGCALGRLTFCLTHSPMFLYSSLLFKHVRIWFSSSTSSSFHWMPWPSPSFSTALGKRDLEKSV